MDHLMKNVHPWEEEEGGEEAPAHWVEGVGGVAAELGQVHGSVGNIHDNCLLKVCICLSGVELWYCSCGGGNCGGGDLSKSFMTKVWW